MTDLGSFRSRPKGAYDVFLSFRGKDTRKNFTDHLYNALVQAGVYTFRDDTELPRGEEISKHLLKAIQDSKISIVVFSEGYASSKWCLNELVEILECKNRNTNHIVLPIFYDIDPSDVRKQTGSFAKAFDKHEERFKGKAKKWRKALEEAGNLSGWNLSDMENRHESKVIQKIIEDVFNILDPKYLDVATHLVGIDLIVRDINNFLSTTTDDVCMVGIHGMAGIGKTTVAKVVFNRLFNGFEGSCFLSNVKETSEQPNGLVLLQEQLLCDLLKRNVGNINNVDRGMNVIKERVCHKRVLVVLDDVDQLKQLNALMRERSWYGLGSRIIITTRNERLLVKADKKYEVRQLKQDESLQLFSWHAFGDKLPIEDYAELSNDVVDYSGGLPLALEVLGCCLSKKNKARWKYVVEKLRKIPNRDIQEKLRISFDKLDDDKLQNIFLDIACFFVGGKKEFVAKVLEARCGFNPEDDLENLIERSLITIDIFGKIHMHDLLRDMGREIIREMSPDHLGKRNRICHHEDAWNVLIKQMGTKAVEGLTLDMGASKVEPLSTESFAKMKYLQLLKINGIHLIGSFKVLSKGLIWLCWHRCPLKSLAYDFELSNLVVLDMQYSNIKELWKETKILNKLKILNLSYCKDLAKATNFLGLPNLERLILKNCMGLLEVPQSIGHLKMLVFLNLEGCCRLKILPDSICDLKSLETLNISGCLQLEKLPKRMGDMESLTELLADGIENKQFHSSIGYLKYARKLSLRGYSFNQDSPSSKSWVSQISSWLLPRGLNWKALVSTSLAGWRFLIELKLGYCSLSETATNYVDFGNMTFLEELDLSGNRFFNLPSGIHHLSRLRVLNVTNCINLLLISELPSRLEDLYADGCTSMERVRLPIQSKTLPVFSVNGCRNLLEIEGAKGFGNCYRLSINYNTSLVEALSNHDYCYWIYFHNGDIPDWFSYRGKECSLSFHLPPFVQGLVLWIVFESVILNSSFIGVIIKNKSNGMQLFKFLLREESMEHLTSWMTYLKIGDMQMEGRCGEEWELYLEIRNEDVIRVVSEDGSKVKEIAVHMIVENLHVEDADEIDSQTGIDMLVPKLYHCFHHPLLGSIAFSTNEQWKFYFLKELPKWDIYLTTVWRIYVIL